MKKRLISAIIILLILTPIVYFGSYYFFIAVGIISLLAFKEILNLKLLKGKIPIFVKIMGILSMLLIVYSNIGGNEYNYLDSIYLLIPIVLLTFPLIYVKEKSYTSTEIVYLIGLIYLVGLGFNALLFARDNIYVLIYLLSITVIGDTFAYISGRLVGKNKLCPKVSPNKTVEGAIGGLIASTGVSLIVYQNLIAPFNFKIIIMTIFLGIASQIGDLIYSKIKRDNNIKDYSNLIPGHGGILDRLDSILITAFVYMILSTFI